MHVCNMYPLLPVALSTKRTIQPALSTSVHVWMSRGETACIQCGNRRACQYVYKLSASTCACASRDIYARALVREASRTLADMPPCIDIFIPTYTSIYYYPLLRYTCMYVPIHMYVCTYTHVRTYQCMRLHRRVPSKYARKTAIYECVHMRSTAHTNDAFKSLGRA